MKILKVLLVLIVGLAASYLVTCFFGPTEMNVVVTRPCKGDANQYRLGVANFEHWANWSPWRSDVTAEFKYSGKANAVGHKMEWEGEEMGSGSQVITHYDCDALSTSLDFGMGMVQSSDWRFKQVSDGEVELVWTYNGGEVPFWNRGLFWLLDAQKMIESDYNKGLSDLETWVNKSNLTDVDPCAIASDLGL